MGKNNGSIMLEVVASTFVLIIIIGISLSLGVGINKSINQKREMITLKESLGSICNEVKFNNKFIELKNRLRNGIIKIEYTEDFLNEIINKPLLMMPSGEEKGNNIEISPIYNGDDYLKLKVRITYKGEVHEQEIYKAPWMDEI